MKNKFKKAEIRALTAIVAAVIVLSAGTLLVIQSSDVQFEGITGKFLGGDGSSGNPYQINNCSALQAMKDDLTAHYVLVNDIDCSDTINWNLNAGFEPIGNGMYNDFEGSFNGRNHIIRGLYIYRPSTSYVGLFGFVESDSNITNVGLINVSITGDSYVGCLAGTNEGEINRTFCVAGNITGISTITGMIGGLVGKNNYGTIGNSYSINTIKCGQFVCGGLVGQNEGGDIIDSYSASNITNGVLYLGGLVASLLWPSPTIKNSFATGIFSGGGGYIGGLVGDTDATTAITNSFYNNRTGNPDVCVDDTEGSISCIAIQNNESYFYNSSNEPLASWDFTNIWQENENNYPTLEGFFEAEEVGDFGDAPDSTNHIGPNVGPFGQYNMTAYPKGGPLGTKARYPTVFDPLTGTPQGPCHAKEYLWVFLGENVSVEADADLLPDNDTIPNINVTLDSPDQDLYDDGLNNNSLNMTNCTLTNFTFNVTITHNIPSIWGNYSFDAWFDWNRDGDWEDNLTCFAPDDTPEHAVQNQTVFVGGQPSKITLTFTSQNFLPYNPKQGPMWIRMTLAPNESMKYDGSGPNSCFEDGETEDYYVKLVSEPSPEPCPAGMSGSGNISDPCLVTNCDQLQNISRGLSKHYALVNDIDCNVSPYICSGYPSGLVPIGTSLAPFTGTLDGRNHTIYNLCIFKSDINIGLFGCIVNASIKNLGLENADVNGETNVGALVGRADHSNISRCYSTGYVYGSVSYLGGLVGWFSNGIINNTYSRCEVETSSSNYGGGLVGVISAGKTYNSYATGKIHSGIKKGGISGTVQAGINPTISNSFFTGDIISCTQSCGGITGYKDPGGVIINSYWDKHTGSPAECYCTAPLSCDSSGCGFTTNNIPYYYNKSNPPLSSWDFTNVWKEHKGKYPTLKGFLIRLSCKEEIFEDTILNNNLVCSGLALKINTDDIILDCSGFNISGNGTSSGILVNADNVTIKNCNIYNFTEGISMNESSSSKIINNTINNNTKGIGFYNITAGSNNNSVIYNDIIYNTESGIHVKDSYGNNVSDNLINYNRNGISVLDSYEVTIFNNTISDNSDNGIYMEDNSKRNSIIKNMVLYNDVGININETNVINNSIYDNFFNNTINVIDIGDNKWNTTYYCYSIPNIIGGICIGGNFWSDYTGDDDGSGSYPHNITDDGIGDTEIPYNSSGNITSGGDYLPLVPDITPPSVTDLQPLSNSSYGIFTVIEIAANVTDMIGIDTVLANITFPNSTAQQITLNPAAGDKYNNSFSIPNLLGRYNITIIADDNVGNINDTETTWFNAVCIDNDGDGYNISGGVCGPADCDDTNNSIWQNLTGYIDNDGDNYGTGILLTICSGLSLPSGYSSTGGDCNDSNSSINPGQNENTEEKCTNGQDDDCDGKFDCADSLCTPLDICQPEYDDFDGDTTDFDNVSDITNVTNCTLERVGYGKIVWNNPVNAEGADFDSYVQIERGFIAINLNNLHSSFNSSANITLYNIDCKYLIYYNPGFGFSAVKNLISGGQVCNETTDPNCANISCINNTLIFTVNHFSGFGIGPNCGDAICELTTECDFCKADCTFALCCGNGQCNSFIGENSNNCRADCKPETRAGGVFLTACYENWNCTDWGPCMPDGMQYRECFDTNSCDEKYNQRIISRIYTAKRPKLEQNCTYAVLASCNNGIKDAYETDIDCGGNCPSCEDGKSCLIDSDCINKCDADRGICYTSPAIEVPAAPAISLLARIFGFIFSNWLYLIVLLAIIAVIIGVYTYLNLDKMEFYQKYMAKKAEKGIRKRAKVKSEAIRLKELEKRKAETMRELHKRLRREYSDKLELFLDKAIDKGYKKTDIYIKLQAELENINSKLKK